MNMAASRYAWCLTLLLSACGPNAAQQVVPDPTAISVETAISSVIRGIRLGEQLAASSGDRPIGLNTCTVSVSFNVTAGGEHKNELVLDAAIKAGGDPISGSGEVKSTTSNSLTANRGNQISLLFTSPACNPEGTLGTAHPTQVGIMGQQMDVYRRPYDWRIGGQSAPDRRRKNVNAERPVRPVENNQPESKQDATSQSGGGGGGTFCIDGTGRRKYLAAELYAPLEEGRCP